MLLENLPTFTPSMTQFCRYIFQHHGSHIRGYNYYDRNIDSRSSISQMYIYIYRYIFSIHGAYQGYNFYDQTSMVTISICGSARRRNARGHRRRKEAEVKTNRWGLALGIVSGRRWDCVHGISITFIVFFGDLYGSIICWDVHGDLYGDACINF